MVKLRLKSIKQTICSCFAVVAPARTLFVPEEEQQVVLFDQVTSGSNVEPNGLKTKLASLQTTLATCGYHFPFRCLADGIFSRQLNCFTRTLFVKEKKRNQLQCEVILSRFLFFVTVAAISSSFAEVGDRDVLVVPHDRCVCLGFSCGTFMSVGNGLTLYFQLYFEDTFCACCEICK